LRRKIMQSLSPLMCRPLTKKFFPAPQLLTAALLLVAVAGGENAHSSEPSEKPDVEMARGDQPSLITAIPGASTALSLEECILHAVESNASLRAETARRGELKGQMTQARATGLPTFDATMGWQRGRDPSMALGSVFGGGGESTEPITPLDSLLASISVIPSAEDMPAQTFWRSSVNARWEINPGRVINAIGAAGLGIRRQEAEIDNATNRVIEQVVTGFYGVITTSEYLNAIDADITARTEFLEVTRRRFGLGLATALDTLRAKVSQANLIPQRRSAYQRLSDAGSQLNVLMGRSPLAPLTIDGRVRIETDRLDPESAANFITQRPDLQSLEILTEMMRKNRGAQKSAHRPYISANASYGYMGTDFSSQTDKGHDFWSASVSLNVPLFDGMLTKGQVQETEASIRRMRHQYEEARRGARLEIRSILGDLEAAQDNLSAAKLNLTAAEDALTQITLAYDLGKAEYLSVLSTQSDRYLARSNYIQARHNVLTLTASLKRALGFPPTETLKTISETLATEKTMSESTDTGRR